MEVLRSTSQGMCCETPDLSLALLRCSGLLEARGSGVALTQASSPGQGSTPSSSPPSPVPRKLLGLRYPPLSPPPNVGPPPSLYRGGAGGGVESGRAGHPALVPLCTRELATN